MQLAKTGREYYDPGPTTTPALTGWEASFDGGSTWVAGDVLDGRPKWLVRGPGFADDTTPSVLISENTNPMIRATDNPEVLVRRGPAIYLA